MATQNEALRAGDRDGPGDTRITDIQGRLFQLGLYGDATGTFDEATTTALRQFQWYIVNWHWRLHVLPGGSISTGLIEPYTANAAVAVSGTYDLATALELKIWAEGGFRPTGMLVRLALARFPNLERSPTFTQLVYPGAQAGEVLVNDNFVTGVGSIDTAAGANRIRVRINQTFRNQNVAPRGAVVPPATRSQHLIGHAMDANFVDGGHVATSAILKAGTQTKATTDFINAVKQAGLRWGGDFSPVDPIHFDLEVPSRSEAYVMNNFFCQRAFADQHPMRTA